MELWTWTQFSSSFPVRENRDQDGAWGRLLRRFIDEKKLLERRGVDCPKWHFRMLPGNADKMQRYYKPEAVVACICREAQSDKPRPLTSYLCDTYYKEFCDILKAAQEQKAMLQKVE